MNTRVTRFIFFAAAVMITAGCSGIRIERSLKSSQNDWIMYGGAPKRENMAQGAFLPPLDQAWEYNALGGIKGTPIVRDSVVVIGTLHGELQAIHLGTGKRLGYLVAESAIEGAPVFDGNNVVVASSSAEESLVSYDLRTGKRNWGTKLGPIESAPLLVDEFIYVSTLGGTVHSIRKSDGLEEWKFESGTKASRKPIRSSCATDGEIIVVGGDDGYVYGLQRATGQLKWKSKADGSLFASPIIVGTKVLVGSLQGTMYCFDLATGKTEWTFSSGSPIYGAAASDAERVYFGASNGVVYGLTIQGEELWSFATRSVVNSAPLIADDVLYFGSLDRTLYALRKNDGTELWKFTTPGRIKVSPVIWNNTMLVISEDKFIIALRPALRSERE